MIKIKSNVNQDHDGANVKIMCSGSDGAIGIEASAIIIEMLTWIVSKRPLSAKVMDDILKDTLDFRLYYTESEAKTQ